MTQNQPLVSIGMPVYNGEKFIRAAIDSILSQTYSNFELIISDNNSTDGTAKICREYAARDERIYVHQNSHNEGAARNFNKVFNLSKGTYFKWAAHDDLIAPDLIEKCLIVLEQNPDFVLCHSQVRIIDEQGNFVRSYNTKLQTDSLNPVKRCYELLFPHLNYQIYGVIRSSVLRQTRLYENYGYGEGVLTLELGLLGPFYEISEYLLFARKHPQQSMGLFYTTDSDFLFFCERRTYKESMHAFPDFYALKNQWFEPGTDSTICFPHWEIFLGLLSAIRRSKLNFLQQLACHLSLLIQMQGTESLLLKDLYRALIQWWKKQPKALFRQKPDAGSI